MVLYHGLFLILIVFWVFSSNTWDREDGFSGKTEEPS